MYTLDESDNLWEQKSEKQDTAWKIYLGILNFWRSCRVHGWVGVERMQLGFGCISPISFSNYGIKNWFGWVMSNKWMRAASRSFFFVLGDLKGEKVFVHDKWSLPVYLVAFWGVLEIMVIINNPICFAIKLAKFKSVFLYSRERERIEAMQVIGCRWKTEMKNN